MYNIKYLGYIHISSILSKLKTTNIKINISYKIKRKEKIQPVSCNSRIDATLHLSTLLAPGDLANGGRKNKNRFILIQYEC
jgi:hypothetical protein